MRELQLTFKEISGGEHVLRTAQHEKPPDTEVLGESLVTFVAHPVAAELIERFEGGLVRANH